MSNSSDVDEDMKRTIRDAARSQPLGDAQGVRCTDCGSYLEEGANAKAYLVGDASGKRWKLSKVMHPDCGSLYSPENIDRNDDTDALVGGIVVHDPSVSAGGPDETQVTKTDNASFIEAPRGVHRLEDPEILAISMMSDDRRKEREKMRQEAEEMMDKIQSGEIDHPLGDMLGNNTDDEERPR